MKYQPIINSSLNTIDEYTVIDNPLLVEDKPSIIDLGEYSTFEQELKQHLGSCEINMKVIPIQKKERVNIYRPEYINCKYSIEDLKNGIQKDLNARICIYGAPGTGKSAFGIWLAKIFNMDYHCVKGSDIFAKFNGETEQNIKTVFERATLLNSILIIDEIDSFIVDRTSVDKQWEVSQVNEFLVQMENFHGLLITTTNHIDMIDKAALRRFDLKLHFDYLTFENIRLMFLQNLEMLSLSHNHSHIKKLLAIKYCTPGDFTIIRRQHRFHPIKDADDFIERLKEECDIKSMNQNKVGFHV
jgi:transitional endoplasmic reticulum ATPase